MKQADPNNIIKFPSPIEVLWRHYEAAASEKARIYALELAGADEAAGDAAYNAVEDIVDAIVKAEALSKNDLAIKARVLLGGTRGVADVGYYRPESILQFLVDVQMFAAR
jgi:hypothetical protein